jgi:hypothetical protein
MGKSIFMFLPITGHINAYSYLVKAMRHCALLFSLHI